MAARRPFWKWHHWKSIGFCLWPPSTCIWNLKLKFQRKLDLCSGNHVVYRQTDGQTDRRTDGRTRWIQYTPPPTLLGGGIIIYFHFPSFLHIKRGGVGSFSLWKTRNCFLLFPTHGTKEWVKKTRQLLQWHKSLVISGVKLKHLSKLQRAMFAITHSINFCLFSWQSCKYN